MVEHKIMLLLFIDMIVSVFKIAKATENLLYKKWPDKR